MKEWSKMPSKVFMEESKSPLRHMTWSSDKKSDYIAALMIYMVLVHHVNDDTSIINGERGSVSLSYEALCELTNVSRTKVSKGLDVLEKYELVTRSTVGRINIYEIVGYLEKGGWAKLPAKGLYDKNQTHVESFKSYKLRSKVELNALKIYLVLVAFRDNSTNHTKLGYEKISQYAFVQRSDIKSALSLLVASKFIHIDSIANEHNAYSTNNVYRLCFLEVYKHRGTRALSEFLV
jgi:DNA-binding transcriptional ArsR family regulator